MNERILPRDRTALARTLGALFAASMLIPGEAPAAVSVPTDFVNDVIVTSLEEPNSFAFLPDGRVLLTEQRTGRVRMVVNGAIAASDPVLTVPDLNPAGYERGLQGIAIDPEWPARPYVYLFYPRNGGFHRLVRYAATGDLSDPSGGALALADPLLLMDDIPDENPNHNSGCLRFGPDGMLYLSLGDDDIYPCLAADTTALRGKILRMDVSGLPDGAGPQVARTALDPGDNPWSGSANLNQRLVYAFGMRNPWRFQIDPVDGVIIGADVGEADFEEINEIHAGDFLGWPWREANLSKVRSGCPEPGGVGAQPYVAPIAFFGRDSELHAVVSAGMYRPVAGGASNWGPEYAPDRGDVFYMDYYIGDLKRITWDGANWVPAAAVPGQPTPSKWATGLVTGVDFQVGPDGSLWWLAQFDDQFNAASGTLNRIRTTVVTSIEPPITARRPLRLTPNPSAESVEMRYSTARAGRVRISVFGIDGAAIRVVVDEFQSAGTHRATWDGTGAPGTRVAPGVYFVRIEREGSPAEATRMLRIR